MTTSDTSSRPRRIWLSLVAGCVLGLPAGWLLASLAVLPMFLGLFFFLLLGLLIGATMYRFGKPAAPVPRSRLLAIGGITAVAIWGVALVVEYSNLPDDAVRTVRESFRGRYLAKEDVQKLQAEVRRHVPAELRENYPPGGFLGYLRWAAASGEMKCPRVLAPDTEIHTLYQARTLWVVRVVVSLVLLGFALIAQFIGLAEPAKSTEEMVESEQQPP